MAKKILSRLDAPRRMRPASGWFKALNEFADSTVLKVFGARGAGVFAVPSVVAEEVSRLSGVREIATLEDVRERFYAISIERRVRHPAVVALYEKARQTMFGETAT